MERHRRLLAPRALSLVLGALLAAGCARGSELDVGRLDGSEEAEGVGGAGGAQGVGGAGGAQGVGGAGEAGEELDPAAICALGAPVLPEGAAEPAGLGDAPGSVAEAADLLAAIHEGQIALGFLALIRSTDADVLALAEAIVLAHRDAEEALEAELLVLGLMPSPHPLSALLEEARLREAGRLLALHGAAFDHAFMDAQVLAHAQALYLLRWNLIHADGVADASALRELAAGAQTGLTDRMLAAIELRASLAAERAGIDLDAP